MDVFGDTGEVVRLQLEVLRQALVGSVAGWQLASVRQYAAEAFEDGCELLSDDVSDKELSVPLVLVLCVLELPDGELGKDTEDSLVVVSVTGCELAG